MAEIATILRPETILAWQRSLVARKFDGSRKRSYPGRPRTDQTLEAWVVRLAQENRAWGYDRVAGALGNLGHTLSDQTVGNILRRHGIPRAPERRKTTMGQAFIGAHRNVLVATDFFTPEVWTRFGLVTYDVLFFIHLASRRIQLARVTPHPDQGWMGQIARNATMAGRMSSLTLRRRSPQ